MSTSQTVLLPDLDDEITFTLTCVEEVLLSLDGWEADDPRASATGAARRRRRAGGRGGYGSRSHRARASVRRGSARQDACPGRPLRAHPAACHRVARTLDAYQAAGKALDPPRAPSTSRASSCSSNQGRDGTVPLQPLARRRGHHGELAAIGTRRRFRVTICAACAASVRKRDPPRSLMDRRDGREVPYFEIVPERSVWAATGYGPFADELVARVLRGATRR